VAGEQEMRSNVIVLTGIGMGGVVAYLLLRKMAHPKQAADIQLKAHDLNYPDLSREDLISNHLTDLNAADSAQLQALGLDAEAAERLIESRPYRSKLELVSRMVLAENLYREIKDKIGVSNAREPFKVA
jgi:DNA uptake protein ComE-like DNA-binding protein